MNNRHLENIILEKYLHLAVSQLPNAKYNIIRKDSLNFKCNICGDSKTKIWAQRGYLVKFCNTGGEFWYYKCMRPECICNEAKSAKWWLKETNPILYDQFENEFFNEFLGFTKNAETMQYEKPKPKPEEKMSSFEIITSFKKINKNDIMHINYLKKRRIGQKFWNRFYTSTHPRFSNRLIIPFFNDNNELIYFQGRSLVSDGAKKYLNDENNKDSVIYNLNNIDKSKPVFVFEGIFNTFFIDNSIAVLGVNFTNAQFDLIKDLDLHFFFDNDVAGKKGMLKMLKKGYKVFNWDTFLKKLKPKDPEKISDLNDLAILLNVNKFNTNTIREFFTNHLADEIYFI